MLPEVALKVQKDALAIQKKEKKEKVSKTNWRTRNLTPVSPTPGDPDTAVIVHFEDGVPNFGVYGGGEAVWWALSTKRGQQNKVIKAIQMADFQTSESSGVSMQTFVDSRIPVKRVPAWSPKYKEMRSTVLKYDDGSWLLLKAKLTNALVERLQSDANFLAFRHFKTVEGTRFPVPCPQEDFERIEEWQQEVAPLDAADILQEDDQLVIADSDIPGHNANEYMQELLNMFNEPEGKTRDQKSAPTRDSKRRGHEEKTKMESQESTWYDGASSSPPSSFSSATEPEGEIAGSGWYAPSTPGEDEPQSDGLSWWDDVEKSEEEKAVWTPGAPIEVISGPFAECFGVVSSVEGERISAELDIFGTKTLVELALENVRSTEDDTEWGGK